ncbi:hypothetical protein B0H14DRAFT_2625012 [Mycena olivaceomarginata]|nr:hypothetical protein B0H14DRAFT_2625012 [Mycena olivaceomarginata]
MACFRSCRQLKCYYGLNPLDLLSGNQFLASWSSLESGPLILPAQTLGAYAGSQRTSLRLCDSLRATYDHRGSAETAGARRNSTLVLSLRDQVVNIACTAEGVRICRIPADLLRSAFFCAPTPPELSSCLQAPSPSTSWSPPSNTGRLAAKCTFSDPTPPELSSCLQAPSPSTSWFPAIEYRPACCEAHFLCSHPTRTFIASASPLTVKIVVPAIEYRPACCEVHFLCSPIMVGGMIQRRSRQYTTSTLLLTISSSFGTRMGEDQNVAADLEGERRRMLGCVQLHVRAAQEDVDVSHAMSTGNIWASCRRTRWKTWSQRMAATTRKTVPACDLPSLDVVGSGLSKLTSSRTTRHSEHFIWLLLPQNLDQWTSFSLLRNLAHHALASTSATTPLPGTPYPVFPTHFAWGTRHSAPKLRALVRRAECLPEVQHKTEEVCAQHLHRDEDQGTTRRTFHHYRAAQCPQSEGLDVADATLSKVVAGGGCGREARASGSRSAAARNVVED